MRNAKRTGLIGMLALLLLLLFFHAGEDRKTDSGVVHRVLASIVHPVQYLLTGLTDGLASAWYGYIDLVDARKEADEFRARNRILGQRIQELESAERENARLRNLLNMARRHPLGYLPTRVIGTDILGQFRTVTISNGSRDGVRLSAPVLDADGIVGKVLDVYPSYARVLLMIDPNSSIDGVIRRTGARGIVKGNNKNDDLSCVFAFSLSLEDVKVGDVIESSGLDQQFPPDLVIGEVVEVIRSESGMFQEPNIRPRVDFTRLRELLVVVPSGGEGRRP